MSSEWSRMKLGRPRWISRVLGRFWAIKIGFWWSFCVEILFWAITVLFWSCFGELCQQNSNKQLAHFSYIKLATRWSPIHVSSLHNVIAIIHSHSHFKLWSILTLPLCCVIGPYDHCWQHINKPTLTYQFIIFFFLTFNIQHNKYTHQPCTRQRLDSKLSRARPFVK
jgi:hypothetical protein